MKKLFISLVTLLAAVTALSANDGIRIKLSGEAASETRKVEKFTKISTSAGIDVLVTQSNKFNVEVKADKNVIGYVKTEVNNGCLMVGYEKSISITGKGVKTEVFVTFPAIEALSASSAGDIILQSDISADNLQLSASSSGDVKAAKFAINCKVLEVSASSSGDVKGGVVTCDKFSASASSSGDIIMRVSTRQATINASSSGDVKLGGNADYCSASASSGSDIVLAKFVCKNVTAKASSGAGIIANVSDSLEAKASSGADIQYTGNPARIDRATSSGGSIKYMKAKAQNDKD